MMDGLETQMKSQMREKIEERVARDRGISVEEAIAVIKEMSFAEYRKVSEANPTPQGGSQLPGASSLGQAQQQQSLPFNDKNMYDATKGKLEPGMDISYNGQNIQIDKIGGSMVDVKNADGTITRIPRKDLMGPLDDKGNPLVNAQNPGQLAKPASNGKPPNNGKPTNEPSMLGQMKNNFTAGFNKGLADDIDHEELNRIRELAGIEETSTAGATCAGGIASSPSIIGDTSDSHKPTNKLKTKNRLKRERKKLKKNQD